MKYAISAVIVLIVAIIGLTLYLSPDDLVGCNTKPAQAPARCQAADAIIVISGGDTTARTDEAIRLFQNGWAPLLVMSGAAADKSGPSNAEVMRQRALTQGVPAHRVLVDESSETTRQNAQETGRIIAQHNIKRVLLVTSGYHMRRAGLEFRSHVGDGIDVRFHPVSSDRQWSVFWWLTPTGWFLAGSEMVKIISFYIGGTK